MMTLVCRHWNKYIRCHEAYYTPMMQAVLANLDKAMKTPLKVLKDDPTSTVVVIEVDARPLVIKRSNTKGPLHFFRRLFGRSRAKKNWHNAKKLLKIGINTFEPIALLEERYGPLKGRSYFICTYLQGKDAGHYFQGEKCAKWEQAAKNIAKTLQQLAQHEISHHDLNLSNILLIQEQPWLIDLDAMRQHHFCWTAKRGARKERARFMKNWQETPDLSGEISSLFLKVFNELDTCERE